MDFTNNLTNSDITNIMNEAKNLKINKERNDCLKDVIFGLLFFEPSTRTLMSFESAIYRLGGKVIKYNSNFSSEKKGETIEDTIRTIDAYVDVFVIRHPDKEVFKKLKKFTKKPIINAGNGNGEHPTQALLDLFTILEYYPNLPNKIAFTGDIKNSRTIHSLVYLLAKINSDIYFYFVSCESLKPDGDFLQFIESFGNDRFSITEDLNDIINCIDVLYVTRVQKERFNTNMISYHNMIVDSNLIKNSKDNLIILHPLPRNDELSTDLDNNPKSKYFEQVENGVYVRMSILKYIISKH